MSDEQKSTPRTEEEAVADLIARGRPRRPVPADAHDRVHEAVRAAWRDAMGRKSPKRERRWAVPVALAASIVLAGFLVARFPFAPDFPAPSAATVMVINGALSTASGEALRVNAALASGTELRTGSVGRAALRLTDGTSVRLDRDTRVTLIAGSRMRLAAGAVYVDTADVPADESGVIIGTPHATATDLGTQFEVRLADESTVVRVREGVVAIRADDLEHVSRAGEAARVSARGKVVTSSVTPYDESWEWAMGVAPAFDVADGRALSEFLNWAARELGLVLRYEAESSREAAMTVDVSGSLAGMNPREALAAVMATTAFDYRVADGRLLVYRP